jgi:DNA-binding CsgD family transcriptional regulator
MSAKQIIQDVCDEFGIDADQFLNKLIRNKRICSARAAACNRMKLEGFSINQISRFLKIGPTAVGYHLYPKRRMNVRRNGVAYIERQRMAA